MPYTLVVVRAFGPHAQGAMIDDEEGVRALLASEHANDVVRVTRPTPVATKQEG